MATAATLIAETHRYLLPTAREALNTLSGSVNSSVTTLTFNQDIANITAGSTISVDLELMYVWSVTTASKTATVQRGMQGSTAATHADAALVTVNPRFSDFAILQAINADLDDLSSPSNGLFQVPTPITLTYKPQINGYDLGAITNAYINILAVRYDIPGPWKTWPELRRWQIKRDMKTSDFASGIAIVLYEAAWPGRDIRVTYSTAFTHFAATTDDITTVAGLPATCADIPPLGAAARLASVRETQRNQFESQGDTRRATEVPPNAQLAGATALLRTRQLRIKAEAARLSNNYPTRRKTGA